MGVSEIGHPFGGGPSNEDSILFGVLGNTHMHSSVLGYARSCRAHNLSRLATPKNSLRSRLEMLHP